MPANTILLSLFLLSPVSDEVSQAPDEPTPASTTAIVRRIDFSAKSKLVSAEPLSDLYDARHLTSKKLASVALRFDVTDRFDAPVGTAASFSRTYGRLTGRQSFKISAEQFADARELKSINYDEPLRAEMEGAIVRFHRSDEGVEVEPVEAPKLGGSQLAALEPDLDLAFFCPPEDWKASKGWKVDAAHLESVLRMGRGLPLKGKRSKRMRTAELAGVLTEHRPFDLGHEFTGEIRVTRPKLREGKNGSSISARIEVEVRSHRETPHGGGGGDAPTGATEHTIEYSGKGTLRYDVERGMMTELVLELGIDSTVRNVFSFASPGFPNQEFGYVEVEEGSASLRYTAEVKD